MKIYGFFKLGPVSRRNYDDSSICITLTVTEVEELISTKCEMIALDMTNRKRSMGEASFSYP